MLAALVVMLMLHPGLNKCVALVTSDMMFSRRLPDSVFLTTFGVSIKACRKQCEARPNCLSVNYRHLTEECQFNERKGNSMALEVASGYVYIAIPGRNNPTCGTGNCNTAHVCFPEAGQCKECPVPEQDHLVHKGNMYTVGSRIKLGCSSNLYLLTGGDITRSPRTVECLASGNWNQSFSCDTCSGYLVNGPSPIQNESLTASSLAAGDGHSASAARLSRTAYPGAWCANASDAHPYIQASFPETKFVTAVVTKGRHISEYMYSHYVTDYTVSYSVDCDTDSFTFVLDVNGSRKIFDGNVDLDSRVVNNLSAPAKAQCIRIHPGQYIGHVCLRFNIKGCGTVTVP